MSEHEEVSENEEEEEEEEVEEIIREAEPRAAPQEPNEEKEERRRHSAMQKEEEPKQLTEAEMAMMAAKKRHEEEEAAKLLDYEEKRLIEKERIEEELRELKEKQAERKKQREEEFKIMAERQREEDKRRHEEELERKARIEAQRRQKEENRRKKHDISAGILEAEGDKGKNYTIDKSGNRSEMAVSQSKAKNAEQMAAEQEEAKKCFLAAVSKQQVQTANMLPNDLKNKIKQLHSKICKLEGEKYDLEKRHERQEYDLKELHERELQVARHKALKSGLNPEEAVNSPHPPKVKVASKFDRQIDQRSYVDRRELYEHPIIKKRPKIAHGTARPPPEWGRRDIEELEIIRKTADRPQYVEVVKAEGDAARPPVQPIPLAVPDVNEVEEDDEPEPEPELVAAS